jgi:MFS family permease
LDRAIATGGGVTTPAALAEPTAPVRANWVSLLFLANIGLWLAIYAPLQVLLPEQVASLHDHVVKNNAVPSGTDAVLLSVVMGVGAIAGLIANPVVGALSDRTTSSRGRRHPWTLGCGATARRRVRHVLGGGAGAADHGAPGGGRPGEGCRSDQYRV